MKILGLTGSIGMGKSTVAAMFRQLGCRVSDADALAHRLMQPHTAAFAEITHHFPTALQNGQINRRKLGQLVFPHPEKLALLESILHPRIRALHHQAIAHQRHHRAPLLVLEIPLLFETNAHELCDAVATVTAPAFLQRQRVLARPGMTAEKFAHILTQQLPDAQKRQQADFIIQTGLNKAETFRAVQQIINELTAHTGA